jgi:hypothetical protein
MLNLDLKMGTAICSQSTLDIWEWASTIVISMLPYNNCITQLTKYKQIENLFNLHPQLVVSKIQIKTFPH